MAISKKQLISIILLLSLMLILPLTVYYLKGRFDIRPKAVLSGAANFKLNADKTNLAVGQRLNVLVSLELTNTGVRSSGVDFSLLYDTNKLMLVSATPTLGTNFTQTVILDDTGQLYNGEGNNFSYARISMISEKPASQLPGGTLQLANITFEAIQNGAAIIKFPNDNTQMQVVGTSI